MNKKVYMHSVGSNVIHTFHSSHDIKKIDYVLSSGYLLSKRNQGEIYSRSFSGLDYISLCDYEKINMTNNNVPFYNAYHSYIKRGIAFAFRKEDINKKYKVIVPHLLEGIDSKKVFTYMDIYGNMNERYSDLPDEVQVKDEISLKYISYLTYPCSELFDSRLFIGRDSKRKNLIKEIKELKNVLMNNGYNVDVYDITSKTLLNEEGIEKVLRLY